jgi:sugar phosphate permease
MGKSSSSPPQSIPAYFRASELTSLFTQLCLLYLLAFLDRTNIGNAKIAGMTKDLGLSTSSYNATLTIFFVSYAVFEPLTNILLKRMRPSVFIPIIM